jgi:hypothetical protein
MSSLCVQRTSAVRAWCSGAVVAVALATRATPASAQTPATTPATTPAATPAATPAPTPATDAARVAGNVELSRGRSIRWGLGIPLIRIGAVRNAAMPGHLRVFEPEIAFFPLQAVASVTYAGQGRPWQLARADGQWFRFLSVSGLLLLAPNTQRLAQSEVAIGASVNLIDDIFQFGLMLDLYRGVPVRSAALVPGGDTVATGVLGSIFATDGEFTIENVFFVVNANISGLLSLTGVGR